MTLPDHKMCITSLDLSLNEASIHDVEESAYDVLMPLFPTFYNGQSSSGNDARSSKTARESEEDGEAETELDYEALKEAEQAKTEPHLVAEKFVGSLLDAFGSDQLHEPPPQSLEFRAKSTCFYSNINHRCSSSSLSSECDSLATVDDRKKKEESSSSSDMQLGHNGEEEEEAEREEMKSFPVAFKSKSKKIISSICEASKMKLKELKQRRRKLPRKAREILSAWFESNVADPYPSDDEREELLRLTGLSLKQIHHWFTNRRKRDVKWRAKYLFRGRGRRPKNASKLARAMAAAMAAKQNKPRTRQGNELRQQRNVKIGHKHSTKPGTRRVSTRRRTGCTGATIPDSLLDTRGGGGPQSTVLAKNAEQSRYTLKRRRTQATSILRPVSSPSPPCALPFQGGSGGRTYLNLRSQKCC